jgi:hypothetical protein
MASRALIVAIEAANSAELAKQYRTSTRRRSISSLAGIGPEARGRRRDLCAGATFSAADVPTARESIMDAIEKLVADGRDTTEELFVYYSGTASVFNSRSAARARDHVASDFESAARSG